MVNQIPGPLAFFGSGETSPSGQKIFTQLFKRLPRSPRVSILETPAGFELNSEQVAGRIGEFLVHRLQNFNPQIAIIPARKKGTEFSPDNEEIINPLLKADLIFIGPGSPTYAVRQLRGSLAWQYLIARHRLGAGLALASAATIAVGAYALPVYEIYKVGEDPHWKRGLNLLKDFNLNLVFVPHWNNSDGGEQLDTSRCFVGKQRFDELVDRLPRQVTIIGIDEKTGLICDFSRDCCQIVGSGQVTVLRNGKSLFLTSGQSYPLTIFGKIRSPAVGDGIDPLIWNRALDWIIQKEKDLQPSEEVRSLVEKREAARRRKDWGDADRLRRQIENLGWRIIDTQQGPKLEQAKVNQ